MKKLFLLLLVAGGAFSSVPSLRARAEPVVQPRLERLSELFHPVTERLLNPVFRWSARNESEQILRVLRDRRNSGQPLPRPGRFAEFVESNYRSGRGGNDPWGSPYYLQLTRQEIIVGSPGPDLERDTPDDVIASMSRR